MGVGGGGNSGREGQDSALALGEVNTPSGRGGAPWRAAGCTCERDSRPGEVHIWKLGCVRAWSSKEKPPSGSTLSSHLCPQTGFKPKEINQLV